MKLLSLTLLVALAACGRESSPDGRSQLRDEEIHRELDSIKKENKAVLDSISIIKKEIQELKRK
jgi:hypothetical protein